MARHRRRRRKRRQASTQLRDIVLLVLPLCLTPEGRKLLERTRLVLRIPRPENLTSSS